MPRTGRPRTAPLQRFWAQVHKTADCWLWLGNLSAYGYGRFSLGGQHDGAMRAHRYSYVLHYGPIAATDLVCHRCDNRACVRPDHLFLGTAIENMQDAARKGRMARGERHFRARFTEQDIRAIRAAVRAGEEQRQLARRYGAAEHTIWRIVHQRAWCHVAEASEAQ